MFVALLIQPVWSQTPYKPGSQTEREQADSIDFQKSMSSREPNYAEKQYLAPASEKNYREKYSVSCMIYVYSKNLLTLSVDITILSTYKINRCDPNSFIKTTAAGVKAQVINKIPADFVAIAGPHIQMMDFNNTPVENRFMPIGDLNYSPVARAHLGALDMISHFGEWREWIKSFQYYSPIQTIQDADYTWFPESKLYKIITDKNQTFIMTNLVSEDLIKNQRDIENIAENLGKYMNLPKGWRYEISTLDKVLQVKERQYNQIKSFHMQDEFGNIYMQLQESD